MKRLVVSAILAVALVIVPVSAALATETDTVTVTATPSYLAFTNSPNLWTINGITGNDVIDINTTYYSNPLGDTQSPSVTVADGECQFTISNTSTVITNVKVDISNFSSGSNPMTNSDAGTNGAGIFGAFTWYSGMTYSAKVIAKTTASSDLKANLDPITGLLWGMEILTQTDAWTGGTSSTALITITMTAA